MLKEFNIADGLPSSLIYQTIQDKNGFIWVATDKGVSKYNGYSFENFTVKEGLPSNDVWGLNEDNEGRIWLSTFNNFVYIQNDEVFTLEPDSVQMDGASVNHLINDGIHLVTIYTPIRKIYRFDENLSLSSPLDSEKYIPCNNHIFLFDIDEENNRNKSEVKKDIVLATEWRFSDKNNDLKNFLTPNTTKQVKSVFINSSQASFHFQDSIIRFKNDTLERINVDYDHIYNPKIVSIHNSSQFLLPAKDYIYWLDEDFQIIPNLLLEANLNINTARLDREKNLWISTRDGLFLLRHKAISSKSYARYQNQPLELFSIEQDKSNRIWMGGNNSVLYLFDKDGNHDQFTLSDNYISPITEIVFDGIDGMLLTGNYNYYIPIASYDSKQKLQNSNQSYLIHSQLSNGNTPLQNVKSIFVNNRSIFISHSNKLSEYLAQKDAIKFIGTKIINRTFAMATNGKNDFFLGHTNGLFLLYPDETIELVHPKFQASIIDLKYDSKEYLWVATQGQGLFRYKENKIDTIQELYGQEIDNILISENDIWVSNSTGIHQMNFEPDQPFQYAYKKYDSSNGLISNEVNDFILLDDHIYATTKNGLSVLNIKTENIPIDSSLLHISEISINENDTLLQDNYELEYSENNIRIEFVWLSFLEDEKVRYSFILEGEDENWKSTDNIYKEYTNLSPGNYRFRIKVYDPYGNQLSSEKSITFNIDKPWWLSNWSIFIFSLLIFLILTLIYSLLIRRTKRQIEIKNELDKKFAELELNALQAQMNPHFIFNALNSIQDFIFSKDDRTANKYLVKFSKLMRLFLESSKEKKILFSEELKLLQLYVELEELRFGDKFASQFFIDDTIDQDGIKIPSMIIQPFVENAINHGLKYKDEGGLLKIKFEKKNKAILCTIDDNGIGRAMSKKIKQQNKRSYKSRGLHLVNERKNIFNLMQRTNIEINYIDKTDETNNSLGTKVEIFLSY